MKNNKRNIKFIIGLAVAVLLPLFFIVLTRIAIEHSDPRPRHYGIERIDTLRHNGRQQYDTTFRKVNDIVLTNQLGKKISLNNDLKGKILVLDFFSTDCSDSCGRMAINMRAMERAFAKDPKKEHTLNADVQFISISLDPQRDSFSVLRAYADKYKADHDHWWLLTGDKARIYSYVRNELNINLAMNADGIGHTAQWVTLDKNRYIRGYYNGLDTAGLKHCADDVVFLFGESEAQKK